MNNLVILNDKNLNRNIKDINIFEFYLRPYVSAGDRMKLYIEINDKLIDNYCYDKINNLNKKKKIKKVKIKNGRKMR